MKSKLFLAIIGLVVLTLTTGMTGGCGETIYEGSSYYYPNWMPDGRIICYKVTSRWSNALWGRKEMGDKNYVAAMDVDGSNEQNLFEISGGVQEITCAPTGELIAYISDPSNIGNITVSSYTGTNITKLSGIAGVTYLDWSPDATKIAYSANRKLYVVNTDGTNNQQIATSAEAVAWRTGDKIVYEESIYNKIDSIYPDGSSKESITTISLSPQNTKDGRVVFRGYGFRVESVKIDGNDKQILFDNYERSNLKLSFDNTKIVGGDLDQSWIKGIYVINIDGTGGRKLR